jgi:hypothetical protein
MAIQFQNRRGTVSENNSFTGAAGEVVVDTTTGSLRVHDGGTQGGKLIGAASIDTIAYLRLLSGPTPRVWVSGYHTKDDGAFGSNIFRWNPTSTDADNGGTIIKLDNITTGRYELQYEGAVNVKWFGAVGDGITDDTEAIVQCFTSSHTNITGNGLSYVYDRGEYIDTNVVHLTDMNMIAKKDSVFLKFSKGDSLIINNLNVVGERGTYIEQWDYFVTEGGVESCQPSTGAFIRNVDYTDTIDTIVSISNCSFKDMFNTEIIRFKSEAGGTYHLDNLVFDNVPNKNYHIFFETYGLGDAYVSNITTKDSGILPASFNYKAPDTNVSLVTFGDVGMPMPQGSFLNIVSFGNFYASNIRVDGYSSCAITFDRNEYAAGNNIFITCDSDRAVSNNPTGAIWDEGCVDFSIDGAVIDITKRATLITDVGDASMFQVYSSVDGTMSRNISNVKLRTSIAMKGFRASTGGQTFFNMSNVDAELVGGLPFMTYGYLPGSTVRDVLNLENIRISLNNSINVPNAESISFNNIKSNGTFLLVNNTLITGVPQLVNTFKIISSEFTSTTTPTISNCAIDDLKILGCKFYGSTDGSTSLHLVAPINRFTMSDTYLDNELFTEATVSITLSNNIIKKRSRLENATTLNIVGNTLCTQNAGVCIAVTGTILQYLLSSNRLIVNTGSGGGYKVSPGVNELIVNNLELNNDVALI